MRKNAGNEYCDIFMEDNMDKVSNLVDCFYSLAQMGVEVNEESIIPRIKQAIESKLLSILKPYAKTKPGTVYYVYLNLKLVADKKTNQYDPRLSFAEIKPRTTPVQLKVKAMGEAEDAESSKYRNPEIDKKVLASGAHLDALRVAIRIYNSTPPTKYPDPNVKDKIVLIPRPRGDINWDRTNIMTAS